MRKLSLRVATLLLLLTVAAPARLLADDPGSNCDPLGTCIPPALQLAVGN